MEQLFIPLAAIQLNPFQPRRQFAPEELEELAASIRAVGIIHPPTVRPLEEGYELIAGERRCRAAKMAGLDKIPVVIKACNDGMSAEAALIENLQRVDLNPIEIAAALKRLLDDFKLDQAELAKRVGKKRSTVANYLRLLTLPVDIQQSVRQHLITMGHAKAILTVEDLSLQFLLHEKILSEHLSVRQTEEQAFKLSLKHQDKQQVRLDPRDPDLVAFERGLERALGTKVRLETKGEGGTLTLHYYSLDDLDRLTEKWLP